MPSLSRCDVCLALIACLLLAYSSGGLSSQRTVEEEHKFSHDLRCSVQTERRQWNRNTETIITGTIENLTDGRFELEVDPVLYLSSRTSGEMGDKFWAPVDLLHDSPIRTDKHDDGVGVSIVPLPIQLRFKNKDDKIDFRIDAQHLLWAKQISSVWPSSALFSTVKSDDYDLQLVLETDNGRVESPKVTISIDASKPPDKQQSSGPEQQRSNASPVQETETPHSIARAMFPNAPEKAQSAGCFRGLKPTMSIATVVQKCGRPDEELGSGIYIFVWHLPDGSTISIGTTTLERIGDVRYTDPSGKNSSLLHGK
jgi:hypothetical protein